MVFDTVLRRPMTDDRAVLVQTCTLLLLLSELSVWLCVCWGSHGPCAVTRGFGSYTPGVAEALPWVSMSGNSFIFSADPTKITTHGATVLRGL